MERVLFGLLLVLSAANAAGETGCGVYLGGRELACSDGEVCYFPSGRNAADCSCSPRNGGSGSPCRISAAAQNPTRAPQSSPIRMPMLLTSGSRLGGPGARKTGDGLAREADDSFQAGLEAYNAGDYSAAINGFTKAGSLDTALSGRVREILAVSYYLRAAGYVKEREYGKAIEDCKRSIGQRPDFFKPKLLLAAAIAEYHVQRSTSGGVLGSRGLGRPPAVPIRTASASLIGSPIKTSARIKTTLPAAQAPVPEPQSDILTWAFFLLVAAAAVWGTLLMWSHGTNPFGPLGPEEHDRRIRELMAAGRYDKALAGLSAGNGRELTEMDRIALLEIHLRMGNLDSAWAMLEKVKGSALLAETPALREKLAGLCSNIGLKAQAEELRRMTGGRK